MNDYLLGDPEPPPEPEPPELEDRLLPEPDDPDDPDEPEELLLELEDPFWYVLSPELLEVL